MSAEQVDDKSMSGGDITMSGGYITTSGGDINSESKTSTSFDKLMSATPDYSSLPSPTGKTVFKGFAFILLTAVVAGVIAFLGSLLHRAGVSSIIPYGLIMAFLLVFCAMCMLRSYATRIFNASLFPRFLMIIYFIAHVFMVYQLSYFWSTGTIIVISFRTPVSDSFLYNYAGHIWLYGSMFISVLCMMLPSRLFNRVK
jgi:hypothetical protein